MKTVKIIMLTLLLCVSSLVNAQKWTPPIQISTLQGVNNHSDFCIDHSGNIHCVWSYKMGENYKRIYYSKSTDDGLTWSFPENVSANDTLWMENPHIVADSENNLHVTYDYNSGNHYHTLILHRKFSGNVWSEADTVSTDWSGARHNRLVIDHNDKLHCFWFHDFQNGTTFYRTLENDVWGEIEIPYDNNDNIFLMKAIVDSTNKLHCSAYRYLNGQSSYDQRIVYFTYYNDIWSDITQVSYTYDAWTGNDIALNKNNYPQIVWRQVISDSIPPKNGTVFSENDGENWTEPIILAEDASDQTIAIDINNNTHIIDNEEYEDGYRLVHYRLINNEWTGSVIEEDTFGNYSNKLISRGNYLYLVSVLVQSLSPDYDASIVLRKCKTSIGTQPSIEMGKFNIYPNPVNTYATISYSLKETNYISIKIYDLQGQLINTIIEKKQSPGDYQIMWNGTDKNKKEVNSGLYFIRLQAGRQFITRLVEVIK